jgi:hypothetical protein
VIDAFIATILIVSALVLVYGRHAVIPSSEQAFTAAEGFLLYLENTNIGQFDAFESRAWIAQGVINDTSVSLLYQLAMFNVSGRNDDARTLATLALGAVPPQIGVDLRVANASVANRSIETEAAAASLVVMKRVAIVRIASGAVASPVVVEVRTWQ